MGAGTGGDRPYTPPKPDPDELNVEALFNEYRNLQRRHKPLQGVRLELRVRPSETGETAHYWPSHEYSDPTTGADFTRPPAIRIFLPTIKEMHELWKPVPRRVGEQQTSRGRDVTKAAIETLKHEAAHALQMERERTSGRPDEPVLPREVTPRSRLYSASPEMGRQSGYHMKLFQVLNRALGGSGQRPRFENIGLPDEMWLPAMRSLGEQG